MKRWHIGLIGWALLILLSGSVLAQTTDVPPGHWAYKAVQTLVERGYMDTAPGGVFNGTEAAQRFEVAAAVGRLLEDIEAGRIRMGSGVDTEMLRGLEQEFRAELVQWYSERDRLEAAHAQTQRHIAVIDEQLGLLLVALDDLHTALRVEVASLEAGLAAEALRTNELVADTDADISELDRRLRELLAKTNERVNELAAKIDDSVGSLQHFVDTTFGEYGDTIGAQFTDQLTELAALRSNLGQLGATVERHGDDLDDLDLRLNNYISDQAAALAMRLETTEQNVQRLAADLALLSQTLTTIQTTTGEEIASLRAMMVELLVELHGQVEQLESQMGGLRTDMAAVQTETEALQTELAAVQTEKAALHSEVAKLQAGTAGLQTKVDGLQSNVSGLQSNMSGLQTNVSGLQTNVSGLQTNVSELKTDVTGLQADVSELQSELTGLHDLMGTSEEQIARMTERVRMQLDDQLALSLSRERQLERQLNELRSEFDGYKAQAEEEVKSARNMGTMALGVAALAVLLGLMN